MNSVNTLDAIVSFSDTTREHVLIIPGKFPGGEVRIADTSKLLDYDINYITSLRIIPSLASSDDVMALLLVVDILNHYYPKVHKELVIDYVPYARQDRRISGQPNNESFSLYVFANIINSLNMDRVFIIDQHSTVTTALIKNSINVPRHVVWKGALSKEMSRCNIVSPDVGASKETMEIWSRNQMAFGSLITCQKSRDPATGQISGTQLFYNHVESDRFIIMDDICDGGWTFTEIARSLIREFGSDIQIELWVTHGLFSKGLTPLFEAGINTIKTMNLMNNNVIGVMQQRYDNDVFNIDLSSVLSFAAPHLVIQHTFGNM